MFSEYASRFLAQSRSRLSDIGGGEPANDPLSRRPDWQSRSTTRFPNRSNYLRGNPYNPGASRFGPFASRGGNDAPLFHSALDEFREEEDEEERDREAADLYALQKSRRVFAASRLEESTEDEQEASRDSLGDDEEPERRLPDRSGLRLGIRSSWKGTRSTFGSRAKDAHGSHELGRDDSDNKMEDVGLDSVHDEPPSDLLNELDEDDSPPAFQKFQDRDGPSPERTPDVGQPIPRRSSVDSEVAPQVAEIPPSEGELFRYDPFFAWLYVIGMASLISTFVLVWLHTSTPNRKNPLGDTIYTTLRSSFHLLAVDTIVSVAVSVLWLSALRSFMKGLVGLIIFAVPVVLFAFTLYPFVSSFKGREHGESSQDVAMRWSTIVPAAAILAWFYVVWQGRHAIKQATEILEFSSKILAANSALVLMGMGTLMLVVFWTWAWLAMFTRVFMGGYFSTSISHFIISASSWWLGIYFILMYIWTLSMISGVQRGTTAATVSQWYFHRNVQPAPASRDVVLAALGHATTTIFGTVSESTFLALLIRLPLLLLPRRIGNIIAMVSYQFVPTPIAALTNPLSITYAGIHSQSLSISARGLTQMEFLAPNAPTTTLTPRAFSGRRSHSVPLLPYRLAKLILHATRFVMATALGFAGWVMTARQLRIELPDGIGLRGSAYAYVVGMVASFIGWGVLGAMEGVLSGILDAVVVCYGSEKRMVGGHGGYCMEAAQLFGESRLPRGLRRER
ncbi:uncharacterized protein MKZ38_000536 [Zalerion maritima]|uniref:Protein PNS1 n=1 Tax=Zalerion maritima TaxID=339359 RepID=A0AAD5RRF2_9PEZI|nr:uncharacterized protein MKZ38_000536 [Zalerion maritima]